MRHASVSSHGHQAHLTTDLQLKVDTVISSMFHKARNFAFVGAPWTDPTEVTAAAPPMVSTERLPQEAWAFVVSGHLEGKPEFDGYHSKRSKLENKR